MKKIQIKVTDTGEVQEVPIDVGRHLIQVGHASQVLDSPEAEDVDQDTDKAEDVDKTDDSSTKAKPRARSKSAASATSSGTEASDAGSDPSGS